MRTPLLFLLILSLEASLAVGTLIKMKNVDVVQIDENTEIDEEKGVMSYKEEVNSPFQNTRNCKQAGYFLALTLDRKFATCCPQGQFLKGSKETAFDCCAADHDITGSQEIGSYGCCATCEEWDGTKCKPCKPVAEKPVGEEPAVQKPIREEPAVQKPIGEEPAVQKPVREEPAVQKPPCTSGINAGKCYTFTFPNGRRWGYNGAYYAAAPEEMGQQWGKFKLCKDEDCKSSAPINPGESVRIKDVHGRPKTGEDPNQWLSREINGGHIRKTPEYSKAGTFSLTKWPCGKYCLGGIEEGVAFACPNDKPAATFTTYDKQSCIPLDLLEVPCDIHAKENNCIWRNGSDQCCNKMDCSHVISNGQSGVL